MFDREVAFNKTEEPATATLSVAVVGESTIAFYGCCAVPEYICFHGSFWF